MDCSNRNHLKSHEKLKSLGLNNLEQHIRPKAAWRNTWKPKFWILLCIQLVGGLVNLISIDLCECIYIHVHIVQTIRHAKGIKMNNFHYMTIMHMVKNPELKKWFADRGANKSSCLWLLKLGSSSSSTWIHYYQAQVA